MNIQPLKQFMSRVKTAARAKTPEVRMPVAEANELAATIAELLAELMNKREAAKDEPIELSVDGGSFQA